MTFSGHKRYLDMLKTKFATLELLHFVIFADSLLDNCSPNLTTVENVSDRIYFLQYSYIHEFNGFAQDQCKVLVLSQIWME